MASYVASYLGVFLPCAQYSWDRLRVHSDPDQGETYMNEDECLIFP